MAYSQADLDALQAAIAKGVTRVRMNGEEVQFRSLSEMERIEMKLKSELGLIKNNRVVYPVTSTGWR